MSAASSPPSDARKCVHCGSDLNGSTYGRTCIRCLFTFPATSLTPLADRSLPPPKLSEMQTAFPQYEFLEEVGNGARGRVFKALDTGRFDRTVAIKATRIEQDDLESLTRFQLECKTLAQLRHPNIPAFFDHLSTDDLHMVVMDWMPDGTLEQLLERRNGKRLRLVKIAAIMEQLCDVLSFTHSQGCIHRDVKPANILLNGDRIRLTDFGLIKADSNEPGITRIGVAVGTPGYMAPEQEKPGTSVDHRADLYALGALLFRMVTMREPPKGFIDRSSLHSCPRAFYAVIKKAMAERPDDRFQDIESLRLAIRHAWSTVKIQRRCVALMTAAGIALGFWQLFFR